MGRGTIISGDDEGHYTVELDLSSDRRQNLIAGVETNIGILEGHAARAQEELRYAQLEVDEAAMLVDAMLKQWGEFGIPDPAELVTAHNVARIGAGVEPLIGCVELHNAARDHAVWLRDNNSSGHTGSGGSSPSERIALAGFVGPAGENVAVGVPTVQGVMQGWMASPGHRANILAPHWTHIGVGYAQRGDGHFQHFWVVTFGQLAEGASATAGDPAPADVTGGLSVPEALAEVQAELANAGKRRDTKAHVLARIELELLGQRKRLQQLQSSPATLTVDAWCADYTRDLSGSVGTIEIPGEGTGHVIIRPGFEDHAAYQAGRDGMLMPREIMSPEQAFLAAALLPGWQKFRPTYRVGTLTSVDHDTHTCNVTLDPARSSAQQLDINPAVSLIGVPINYMTCHSRVFEPADRVVVEFQNQQPGAARVIGFESRPKTCMVWPEVRIALVRSLEVVGPVVYTVSMMDSLPSSCGGRRYVSTGTMTRRDRLYRWGFRRHNESVPGTEWAWSMRWPDRTNPPEDQSFSQFAVTPWQGHIDAPFVSEIHSGSWGSGFVSELVGDEEVPSMDRTILGWPSAISGPGEWTNHYTGSRHQYAEDPYLTRPWFGYFRQGFTVFPITAHLYLPDCEILNSYTENGAVHITGEYFFQTESETALSAYIGAHAPPEIEVTHIDTGEVVQYRYYRARFIRRTGSANRTFYVAACYRHPGFFAMGDGDDPREEWELPPP